MKQATRKFSHGEYVPGWIEVTEKLAISTPMGRGKRRVWETTCLCITYEEVAELAAKYLPKPAAGGKKAK